MVPKDPLATSGLPAFNQPSSRGGQTITPKFLILVVDDSVDNVAVISLDLQQQGYRVVTANDGEDAVAVATQMLPNLILMDINLPTLVRKVVDHLVWRVENPQIVGRIGVTVSPTLVTMAQSKQLIA